MDGWLPSRIKACWAKYRTWLIALLLAYVCLVLLLILLTRGPPNGPFQYQIF
jgi:hypothetical protein